MIANNKIVYETCEMERLQCEAYNPKMIVVRNMRDFLARKNANQIWGNGFKFETQNEKLKKIFNKICKTNRLEYLVYHLETQLSLHGRVLITINKTKGGEIKLNVANPFFYNSIGNVFMTEELAVIWQRVVYDTQTYFIKSIYDKEKVVNEIYTNQNQIMVFGEFRKIAKDLQIEEVWYHNLGFVPVVQLTNYPLVLYDFYMFDPITYIKLTDWYPATIFEDTFYLAWKNLNKELEFCHSRIGVENANQQLIDSLKSGDTERVLGDYVIETEVGGKVTAIPGAGDFTKYTNAMNQIMDFYFKFANSSKFSEGGGAQKSSTEAQDSKSTTIETIKEKLSHREYDYSMLFAKMFAAMGLIDYNEGEWDFIFKINGNIEKQENAYVDLLIKQVQAGLMSIPEAIANYRNISENQAEEIFEKIKKFNEENNVMVSTIMSEMEQEFTSGGFDSESNEGGRPSDIGE